MLFAELEGSHASWRKLTEEQLSKESQWIATLSRKPREFDD